MPTARATSSAGSARGTTRSGEAGVVTSPKTGLMGGSVAPDVPVDDEDAADSPPHAARLSARPEVSASESAVRRRAAVGTAFMGLLQGMGNRRRIEGPRRLASPYFGQPGRGGAEVLGGAG